MKRRLFFLLLAVALLCTLLPQAALPAKAEAIDEAFENNMSIPIGTKLSASPAHTHTHTRACARRTMTFGMAEIL